MKIRSCKIWAAAIAVTFLAAPAYALSINDPGVVGAVDNGTENANVTTATTLAQTLLDMGANTSNPIGCSLQDYPCFQTSSTDYNGTLTGGTRVNGASTNVTGFTWVLAKYDGHNAGYVLFHVPTYGNSIPTTSFDIWTNAGNQGYGLSNFTGWNGTTTTVPDGGITLMLLGMALGGLGAARRFMTA